MAQGEVCRLQLKRPGNVCIGPARYDTLYLQEFAAPKRSDYPPPKTGGGWHQSSSRQVSINTPYKTDKSLYSIEFGRVKVPGQKDYKTLRKRYPAWTRTQVAPFIPQFPKESEERYGSAVEHGGPGGSLDFEDTLKDHARCNHGDHKRYVSRAENPTRYPFRLCNPEFVDHDRPIAVGPKPVIPYPKRVTEDDVRNNPPKGWKGTKGFFTPEPNGISSESGLLAASMYYRICRPLEGTLLAMKGDRSIKSSVMS
ncbi:uncharacterized protein [Physcomitrium patens]|uniref:uncharacterized protein isoform X1 n=1 Tax=Physcomitrium patens TaxID=3218 RepID=UPI000D1633C1|nr:uncharacterized protein LOC112276401 isoform X2 [Physcomitrium patens]|eukprot:XP_024363453.1 uncharacterized protein LOC112276401 isoform X2 [Physcomitrella patens]